MYMFSRIYNILYGFLGDSKQGGYDRGTTQYQWDCPECAEENGGIPDGKKNFETSFSLGRCHCWKCGYSGPLSRVVKDYGGTEALKDYYAAVKDIRESKYYDLGLFKDMAENAYLNDYIKLPDTFTKIDLSTCRKRKLSVNLLIGLSLKKWPHNKHLCKKQSHASFLRQLGTDYKT